MLTGNGRSLCPGVGLWKELPITSVARGSVHDRAREAATAVRELEDGSENAELGFDKSQASRTL